jgi:hypothetical protein
VSYWLYFWPEAFWLFKITSVDLGEDAVDHEEFSLCIAENKRKLWEAKDEKPWVHDLFEELNVRDENYSEEVWNFVSLV